jgi:hypothetical protein
MSTNIITRSQGMGTAQLRTMLNRGKDNESARLENLFITTLGYIRNQNGNTHPVGWYKKMIARNKGRRYKATTLQVKPDVFILENTDKYFECRWEHNGFRSCSHPPQP